MKRREFCRQFVLVGGAVVLAPLIKGCAPDPNQPATKAVPLPTSTAPLPTIVPPTGTSRPQATHEPEGTAKTTADPPQPTAGPTESAPTDSPQPAPAAAVPMATVALVKTSDRAFGVRRALELFGRNPLRGNRVLLKPNYNSADAAPASTHPDTLRSLIMEMNEMGARSITVGERSGMGDTRSVLAQTGVFNLADDAGFDIVVFDELEEEAWIVQRSGDFHWQEGFAVPRVLLDTECVVQICNLKTHRFGGHFTMASI